MIHESNYENMKWVSFLDQFSVISSNVAITDILPKSLITQSGGYHVIQGYLKVADCSTSGKP